MGSRAKFGDVCGDVHLRTLTKNNRFLQICKAENECRKTE